MISSGKKRLHIRTEPWGAIRASHDRCLSCTSTKKSSCSMMDSSNLSVVSRPWSDHARRICFELDAFLLLVRTRCVLLQNDYLRLRPGPCSSFVAFRHSDLQRFWFVPRTSKLLWNKSAAARECWSRGRARCHLTFEGQAASKEKSVLGSNRVDHCCGPETETAARSESLL